MDENWDFLLSEFRRLGGIADNVCQNEGEYGRGIFSIDSSLKARIFTPSKYGLSTRLEYSGRTINNIKQERCHKLQ